jgi:hypothetical protein
VSGAGHGFLRAPDGTFTTIDIPGSPVSINPAGAITGNYSDANFLNHSFLRAPDGTITTFDAPNAGTGSLLQGTFAASINPAGAITGHYVDVNFATHGFLRAPDGTITTIDPPGSAGISFPFSINPAGAITGFYCDAITCHGFLRAPDGSFITFDAPGACSSGSACGFLGTSPSAINPAGLITGTYSDANNVSHGFLRIPHGK